MRVQGGHSCVHNRHRQDQCRAQPDLRPAGRPLAVCTHARLRGTAAHVRPEPSPDAAPGTSGRRVARAPEELRPGPQRAAGESAGASASRTSMVPLLEVAGTRATAGALWKAAARAQGRPCRPGPVLAARLSGPERPPASQSRVLGVQEPGGGKRNRGAPDLARLQLREVSVLTPEQSLAGRARCPAAGARGSRGASPSGVKVHPDSEARAQPRACGCSTAAGCEPRAPSVRADGAQGPGREVGGHGRRPARGSRSSMDDAGRRRVCSPREQGGIGELANRSIVWSWAATERCRLGASRQRPDGAGSRAAVRGHRGWGAAAEIWGHGDGKGTLLFCSQIH